MFSALRHFTVCISVRIWLCVEQLTRLFQSQVKERGGDCVPVICDSTNDQEIKDLFEQIKREQNGRLDILVNNAYAGVHVSYTQLSSRGTFLSLFWQLF